MDTNTGNNSPPSTDIMGAVEKLMANPDIMSAVASALGGRNDNSAAEDATTTPKTPVSDTAVSAPALPASVSEILPALSSLSDISRLSSTATKKDRGATDDRICLLNALKPYLSPRRRDAIDKLIRFSGISDILKKL